MATRNWLAAALLVCAATVQAQNYPNQPIKLIVPWPPGGGVDTSARIISQPLSERLGQNIVIENRGGAGGNIGTEFAAKAKADGYTLLMGSSSPNAEVNAILKTPEMIKRLAAFGGEPGGGSPDDFSKFVVSETTRYADIVKASGAKIE